MIVDKVTKLYVDCPSWQPAIVSDDFIIAIGKTKSNSVYHVIESNAKPNKKKRIVRYHIKVLKSDLITALSRDKDQQLVPMQWYNRNKK